MSLDRSLRKKMEDKARSNPTFELEARNWIEEVINEKLDPEKNLIDNLHDGIVLVANAIGPHQVRYKNSDMPFVKMENIAAFLNFVQKLGVPNYDLFQTIDLYERKNPYQVIQCIHSLSRYAVQNVSFHVPPLGPKLATSRKINFTEEQLNKAKNMSNTRQYGYIAGIRFLVDCGVISETIYEEVITKIPRRYFPLQEHSERKEMLSSGQNVPQNNNHTLSTREEYQKVFPTRTNAASNVAEITSKFQQNVNVTTVAPSSSIKQTQENNHIQRAPLPSVPRKTAVIGIFQAEALYDYEGEDDDDLSLKVGDKINVLEYVNEDWWRGTCNGKEGIFPANHVKKLPNFLTNERSSLSQTSPQEHASQKEVSSYSQKSYYGYQKQSQQQAQQQYNPEKKVMSGVGKKFGNAAVFGAGAALGSHIVSVSELREKLGELGLPKAGLKKDLIERLEKVLAEGKTIISSNIDSEKKSGNHLGSEKKADIYDEDCREVIECVDFLKKNDSSKIHDKNDSVFVEKNMEMPKATEKTNVRKMPTVLVDKIGKNEEIERLIKKDVNNSISIKQEDSITVESLKRDLSCVNGGNIIFFLSFVAKINKETDFKAVKKVKEDPENIEPLEQNVANNNHMKDDESLKTNENTLFRSNKISDPIHQLTCAIYVRDFTRPLQISQLKSYLLDILREINSSDDVSLKKFWMDGFKTHAFIILSTEEQAKKIRNSLHNSVWPCEKGRRPLWADYIPEDKVHEWINIEEQSPRDTKWEVVYDINGVPNLLEVKKKQSYQTGVDSNEMEKSFENNLKYENNIKKQNIKKYDMNELFLKTQTIPSLYYKTAGQNIKVDRFKNQNSLRYRV
ncbi:hypothetical protein PCANB_003066 [Pneumocystis canis]|nr:hypothetical protein PCANB_003066 [Pneumocystis canis]